MKDNYFPSQKKAAQDRTAHIFLSKEISLHYSATAAVYPRARSTISTLHIMETSKATTSREQTNAIISNALIAKTNILPKIQGQQFSDRL
jgi:hypothetical protein